MQTTLDSNYKVELIKNAVESLMDDEDDNFGYSAYVVIARIEKSDVEEESEAEVMTLDYTYSDEEKIAMVEAAISIDAELINRVEGVPKRQFMN